MTSTLNPKYTFPNFVIGPANDLAASSASAVAAAPGRAYNPLFIYGATGLGKTHLMQAVAHDVLRRRPQARVLYVTAEDFRNALVLAVQEDRLAEFRARYGDAEFLLVDDVHVLRGRPEAQEEFALTFRLLHDAGRQVVLTSDRPPQSLGVEERLVRQFRWGRIADLGLPDLEHRTAILRQKAQQEYAERAIPHDVLGFLAENVRANVRALEGALVRLVAYATLKQVPITMRLAQETLQVDSGSARGATFGPLVIQEAVAREWGVTPESLIAKRRDRAVVQPRQVAMHLCRELLDVALADIGRAFGGRDHSTVIHGVDRVADEMTRDPALRDRVAKLRDALRRLRDGMSE
jgi:chromosomal replication initiator protein